MRTGHGFTLLEMLVVIALLGLMAAMVLPLRGTLDHIERERITQERMDQIEIALLGHAQARDHLDQDRIIGGYVGHLGDWPSLWEPEPKSSADVVGGELRGEFTPQRRFRWNTWIAVAQPKRESLGQPRGLWSKNGCHGNDSCIAADADTWRGPYLQAPIARHRALARHYAATQTEYENLDPLDRSYFHLLQGTDQLTDGWGHALRFFISGDGEQFWIVSLGPDGYAAFPDDDISNYDNEHRDNEDNIVRTLRRSEWEAVWNAQQRRSRVTQRLIQMTEDRLARIVEAVIGEAPAGPNSGYTGDMLEWPRLYNRVCTCNATVVGCDACCTTGEEPPCASGDTPAGPHWRWESFSYGQPRNLWRQDDLPPAMQVSEYGVGWRRAYVPAPDDEWLRDEWGRPFHFFKLSGERLLILSAGPSGRFRVSTSGDNAMTHDEVSADGTILERHIALLTEATMNYDPGHDDNRDNIARVLTREDWAVGFADIRFLPIKGIADESTCVAVSCRMYGVENESSPHIHSGTWVTPDPEDGDPYCRIAAFEFDDTTLAQLVTGGRYLRCGDNEAAGLVEPAWQRILSVRAHPARIVKREYALEYNATDQTFKP